MKDDWTAVEYERQKRRFIEDRLLHRSIYLHGALLLAATFLCGWVISWALLVQGLWNMPLRYCISFAGSYAVFLLLVRIWANFMRKQKESQPATWSDAVDGIDLLATGPEGCGAIALATIAGLLMAGVFALIGGAPMLLEAAFEVVFAGVVVRRASRTVVVGDWLGTLLRKTAWAAAVTALLLVGIAAYVQHRVPQARTMGEAMKVLLP